MQSENTIGRGKETRKRSPRREGGGEEGVGGAGKDASYAMSRGKY